MRCGAFDFWINSHIIGLESSTVSCSSSQEQRHSLGVHSPHSEFLFILHWWEEGGGGGAGRATK